ncbi:hypothetical protein V8E55_006645 [Tylopilus felleus]
MSKEPRTVELTIPRGLSLQTFSMTFAYDTVGPVTFHINVQEPPHRQRRESTDYEDLYVDRTPESSGSVVKLEARLANAADSEKEASHHASEAAHSEKEKTNRLVTEVTDDTAQALTKILSRRMKEKSKRTKKPTTTILSWDSAAITKQHHMTYEVHSDGSLSYSSKTITSNTQKNLLALSSSSLPTLDTITHNFEPDDIDECSLLAANAEHSIHSESSRNPSAAHPLLAWVNDRDMYLQEMMQGLSGMCPLLQQMCPGHACSPSVACSQDVEQKILQISISQSPWAISAYEFYTTLSRVMDNTGLIESKMLKRASRAYDPRGVKATSEGECAVLCPACPHPGKNLPPNFSDISEDKCWIHAQFVAIDANFRLKCKKVSKDTVDPSLSKGWAYFVEDIVYKAHIAKGSNIPQEKSTCSGHLAVNRADTLNNHGLAATGVGTIDCARHNMKLPNAVGDLQKGEHYSNMDYLFFSAMRHISLPMLNVSYDIACQWSKHIWTQMTTLPPYLQLDLDSKRVTFFVPKFHLPAHIQACLGTVVGWVSPMGLVLQGDYGAVGVAQDIRIATQSTIYHHNVIEGMSYQTHGMGVGVGVGVQCSYPHPHPPSTHTHDPHGEAPERGWANINPAASSTKEMGPGARQDILDDHFCHWNWKKVTSLYSLLDKLKYAVLKRAEFQDALEQLAGSIAVDHASKLSEWQKQILDWEIDQTRTNPYEHKGGTLTMAAVRLELAREDTDLLLHGDTANVHEDCMMSMFITMGLEIEELQRRLKCEKVEKGPHATDNQEARLTEQIIRSSGELTTRCSTAREAGTCANSEFKGDGDKPKREGVRD